MQTFRSLQLEVLRYFDVADEEDGSADVELVKNAINTANQLRVTEDKWRFMLSSQFTLSVTSGTREYILPHENLDKLQYLYSTTNKRFASSVPMREAPYKEVGFNDSSFGDNVFYEIVGWSPVKAQPASADTLDAVSSGTEDAGIKLYIEGEDSSGGFISETVNADATSTQSFKKVTYVAKVGDWEGTLTLRTTVGLETLLVLTSDQNAKQYPVLRWMNTPSSAETFVYRYFRSPRVMTRDNDTPDLPFPVSNVLIYDALLSLATYNELDSESVNIWREMQMKWEISLYGHKLEGNSVAGFGDTIAELGMLR